MSRLHSIIFMQNKMISDSRRLQKQRRMQIEIPVAVEKVKANEKRSVKRDTHSR